MSIKVLVAEDQQVYRSIYAIYFGRAKAKQYTVQMVGNGQEALDAIASGGSPSIIFLDLNMPVMGGEEFLSLLPEMTKAHVPIVVVSTENEAERAQELVIRGARAFLRKPFKFEDLTQLLTQFLPGQ